jgi:hypothetical protein
VKVEKLSISMSSRLGKDIRSAAKRSRMSVSAWLAEAAAAELRRQALRAFLDDWQAKHGRITHDELERAREELGYATRRRSRA